eukprot:7437656-Pyramimonas_sp.AAC.2
MPDRRAEPTRQLTNMEVFYYDNIEDEYQAELEFEGFEARRPTRDIIPFAHNAQLARQKRPRP